VVYPGLSWSVAGRYQQFDLVVVLAASPVIAQHFGAPRWTNFTELRFMKLFRCAAVLRFLGQSRDLFDTVESAATAVTNTLIFLLIVLCVFAIIGMSVLGLRVLDKQGTTPRRNFDTFGQALLTVIQLMTGDQWTRVLYNAMRCTPAPDLHNGVPGCRGLGVVYSTCNALCKIDPVDAGMVGAFFVVFMLISSCVLMKMFIAVIVDNFELKHDDKLALQRALYDAKVEAANAQVAPDPPLPLPLTPPPPPHPKYRDCRDLSSGIPS
jgi:hypothetical protein